MDVKTPGLGRERAHALAEPRRAPAQDEAKFVIDGRADYEWSRELVLERGLAERCTVLFAPVHGVLDPGVLGRWILEDGLPVRLQVQLHKILWPGVPRGSLIGRSGRSGARRLRGRGLHGRRDPGRADGTVMERAMTAAAGRRLRQRRHGLGRDGGPRRARAPPGVPARELRPAHGGEGARLLPRARGPLRRRARGSSSTSRRCARSGAAA